MRSSVRTAIITLAFICLGCSSATAPPDSTKAPASPDKSKEGASVEDAAAILKSINEAMPKDGQLPPGMNFGVTQIGPYQLKTEMDVSISTVLQDQIASLIFGENTLQINFSKGTIRLDGKEVATFPKGSKVVFVSFVTGKLLIKADADVVYKSAEAAETK